MRATASRRRLRLRVAFIMPLQLNSNPTLTHFLRKEVIQPHLPIRLPCYDFTPVIRPAFGRSFPLLTRTFLRCLFHTSLLYSLGMQDFFQKSCPNSFCSPGVRSRTSGISDSHGVTGGVYKTRERIHRDMLIRDY